MEAKANYMLVGSTVSILSILLLVVMIWLAEVGGHKHTKKYTIYFRKYSLAGLQKDSAVTMKGIRVGSVSSLEISPDNIEQVKVIIEVNAGTPIKKDTEAIIDRNLLTGLAHIDLINSHQESELLTEAPPGEEFPVIPEGRTGLGSIITATLPNLLANVDNMARNANDMFSPENRQLLQEMLINISTATSKLSDSQAKLSRLMEETTKLASESRTMVRNLDKRTANVEKSVTETIVMVQERIKAVTPLIRQLQDTAGNLNNAVSDSTGTISMEMEYLVEELVKTAQQFSDTLEQYKNPREIILGPDRSSLGPGEGEQ